MASSTLGEANTAVRSFVYRVDCGCTHSSPFLSRLAGRQACVSSQKGDPMAAVTKATIKEGPKAENLVLHGITITHPGRVISETGPITKGELAEYYSTIAPFMLPQIVRRPLSLLRCPSGVEKQCFFQRNPGKGLGADVRPFEFKNKGKRYEYLYIEDEKG